MPALIRPGPIRCAGSESFVGWIDNTLGIAKTANVIWDGTEDFDFRIMPSPWAVEAAIRSKVGRGHTGRMVAGFCWPWSNPNPDGTLVNDIVIEPEHFAGRRLDSAEFGRLVAEGTESLTYARPWNARSGKRVAAGIPPAELWATHAGGINQVGCIYTAQGFEFDYVGVIFGLDLRYDFDLGGWESSREDSHDREVKSDADQFVDLVKNTYRVLLSRGMKGCYTYFMDEDTERFVRSRME